jgi:hypothetical protein
MKSITNKTTVPEAIAFLQTRADEPGVTRDDLNALIKFINPLTRRMARLESRQPTDTLDIDIAPRP